MTASCYLLVLGEREAIYWVLSQSRTAFVEGRSRQSMRLSEGDILLLYSTRGAWRNPTRDRGRVIAEAIVTSAPKRLRTPIEVAGREFTTGVDLALDGVAPYGQGVDLAALVPQLAMFPDKASWSARLRTSLLAVPSTDLRILRRELKPLACPLADVLPGYRQAARLP